MNSTPKERKIVSAFTFATSLLGYLYAKHTSKDPVPLVMICGFLGAMAGETVASWMNNDGNNTPTPTA